jgi:HlyD family secretion protein
LAFGLEPLLSMDRNLSEEIIGKRKRRLLLIILAVLLVLAGGAWALRALIKPSLKQADIRTAVVQTGDIENTITASGEILPEFEQVITSPITAVIKNVVLEAGNEVKPGQSVLELDKEFTQTEFEKTRFRLESKRINIEKLKLEVNKGFYDLKANDSIKQLKINSLQAALEDAKRLLKAGGGTREEVEQADLNLRIAQMEKRQLENDIRNKQKTMQADIRESEIAAAIEEKDLNELEKKLQKADIIATRRGVITWVNKNIGSTIREGESLVRIADLASFKITGSISDTYLEQLRTGMPVIIRINDSILRGKITNIHPAIQNDIVSFDVQLQENNNASLRPNMKAEIFPVTSIKNNVLRIANGPAFKGAALQDIFVVKNGKAIRRSVKVGMSNFDYVELLNNVQPGEVVIISDMSEYKHLQEISIDN